MTESTDQRISYINSIKYSSNEYFKRIRELVDDPEAFEEELEDFFKWVEVRKVYRMVERNDG